MTMPVSSSVTASGADRYLRLDAVRGQLAVATAGQTVGHSAAANMIGVAAVDVGTAGGDGGVFDGMESLETSERDSGSGKCAKTIRR